jgi:hypothetical protein
VLNVEQVLYFALSPLVVNRKSHAQKESFREKTVANSRLEPVELNRLQRKNFLWICVPAPDLDAQ